jgi:hypothetical protein
LYYNGINPILGGRVIHAPIITTEVRNTVTEWYAHLPPALKFPLDSSPLFDLRKAFLRGQYIAMFVLMGWGSVLKLLELGEHGIKAQDSSAEMSIMKKQAKEGIASCALLLAASEETLSRRNLGSQMILWG